LHYALHPRREISYGGMKKSFLCETAKIGEMRPILVPLEWKISRRPLRTHTLDGPGDHLSLPNAAADNKAQRQPPIGPCAAAAAALRKISFICHKSVCGRQMNLSQIVLNYLCVPHFGLLTQHRPRAHHYSPFTQMINSKPAHFHGTIEAQSNSECILWVTAAEHHMLVGAGDGKLSVHHDGFAGI
jgi:hypothetical protein